MHIMVLNSTSLALTGGSDFTIVHDIISFPAGSRNHDLICIHIRIIDDEIPEKNEYFSVHVNIVDLNAWVCGSTYVNVHIYDDDGTCVYVCECVSA